MKKVKLNIVTSIILQFVTIIYGFVLPRLILITYGSEVNGLITSITQFLSVISLLEMGVGTVVQSALYKPLAENNINAINNIMASAKNFFRRISGIMCLYILILSVAYPMVVNRTNFRTSYIISLIVILSLSLFAEYYFGLVNGLLLIADQKGYIYYSLQIVTQITCIIVCPLLISNNYSIQIVKLVTAFISIIKPCFLVLYVKKNYDINFTVNYTEEPIKQKWNGMMQHFAAIVLDNIDIVLLTLLSTLQSVSIYSVYYLVLGGIRKSVLMVLQSFQPYIGNLWANGDKKKLKEIFQLFEWVVHMILIFVFVCCLLLIIPFVEVYTKEVNDVNYYQPTFAVLLTIAQAVRCFRNPYNMLIFVASKYKETQNSYFVVCVINLVVSLLMIWKFDLIGVAFGTFVAMLYHTIWMFYYSRKHIINISLKKEAKLCIIDILILILVVIIHNYSYIPIMDSYITWSKYAIYIATMCFVCIVMINIIFYKNNIKKVIVLIKNEKNDSPKEK